MNLHGFILLFMILHASSEPQEQWVWLGNKKPQKGTRVVRKSSKSLNTYKVSNKVHSKQPQTSSENSPTPGQLSTTVTESDFLQNHRVNQPKPALNAEDGASTSPGSTTKTDEVKLHNSKIPNRSKARKYSANRHRPNAAAVKGNGTINSDSGSHVQQSLEIDRSTTTISSKNNNTSKINYIKAKIIGSTGGNIFKYSVTSEGTSTRTKTNVRKSNNIKKRSSNKSNRPPQPTAPPVPSPAPTMKPTANPVVSPTYAPTFTAAPTPTPAPSVLPTYAPSVQPTIAPTEMPTLTFRPTAPTVRPTHAARPTHCVALDPQFANFLVKKLDRNLNHYPQCETVEFLRLQVEEALMTQSGLVMGKVGGTEWHMMNYMENKKKFRLDKTAHTNSGIYPLTQDLLKQWNHTYVDALQSMDITVAWLRVDLPALQKMFTFGKPAILSAGPKLEVISVFWPWYWKRPFTELFANKTVLVVSPFSKYIQAQYHTNRTCIFPHQPNVLPEFKQLITIDAPLPPVLTGDYTKLSTYISAGIKSTFMTNLADLKQKVAAVEYDVMLVGAGSLALPLAAAEKQRGKVIIHLAGNLGPLFGLKGGRFNGRKEYTEYFYNNCWVTMQRPAAASKMENSAYW